MDIRKLQRAIVDGLEDVKAQNIVVYNTEALSPLFERVIIASGTSNRQTKALAASVRDAVKSRGLPVVATEGEENGEWIIVDCGAAVAHIMQPAIREYYHLEEIWGGKTVAMKMAAVRTRSAAPAGDAREPAGQAAAAKKPARKAAAAGQTPARKAASPKSPRGAPSKAPGAAARKRAATSGASPAAPKASTKSTAKAPAKTAAKTPSKTAAKSAPKATRTAASRAGSLPATGQTTRKPAPQAPAAGRTAAAAPRARKAR